MSGIFGIVGRDGAPSGDADLARVQGVAASRALPGETLAPVDASGDLHFCAAARLDARPELVRDLGLSPVSVRSCSDPELLLAAYRRWGENAPERLIGDWSLAAWHPTQRRLFLARDRLGNGSVYYHLEGRSIAFAPALSSLLSLKRCSFQLDELYLAQLLISWTAYQGPRTIYIGVKRLPPAHALTVTPGRVQLRSYWQPDPIAELRLAGREAYASAFREVFDEAVRARLPPDGEVAVTLSGGLDSGSVAVTAARALRAQDRRLMAFTSVPVADTAAVGAGVGDEYPLARATAAAAPNIALRSVTGTRLSPIEALRLGLEMFGAPVHSAANLFWLFDLHAQAAASGARVLLTGQAGNGTVSWTGDPLAQSLRYQLDRFGVGGTFRQHLKRSVPVRARTAIARYCFERRDDGFAGTAIHPRFARRLRLMERRLADPELFPRTPRAERMAILAPGRSLSGDLWSAMDARYGLLTADPTSDTRVVEFTLAVPDRIFIDPRTGTDRWLIREAMRGRLPDEVRLNRGRGLQGADLVPRLRACAGEVEAALTDVAAGAAAEYLDIDHLRSVWAMVQRQNTTLSLQRAITVLTRGLMAGLHVNAVTATGPRSG